MTRLSILVLILALCGAAPAPAADAPHGSYLEARSASVFAGPCHYNAELMTAGREALLAWSFEGGEWRGTALAGVRAAALVVADKSLGLEGSRRESVLYLDAGASAAQREAVRALLAEHYGGVLGRVVRVRTAPLALAFGGAGFRLAIEGVALLEGAALPDRACCSMPESVWFRPLIEEDARTKTSAVLVGHTRALRYADEELLGGAAPAFSVVAGARAPRFARHGENSAFLAGFRLVPNA